ncbi:MAG: PAS domain S-box protein [Methanoregula sp.]
MKTPEEDNRIKVLVVEDSRTQAEYLQHILENEGYFVVLTFNGNQALERIKTDRPTIVLTDIMMPEMDGFALCSAIKQNKDMADIPVILVTQLFDPADLVKGLEAGADNIIIKPFKAEHVISRITGTLQSRAHPDSDDRESILEVSFDGKTHLIPSSQLRAPGILLSTYDLAVRKNTELQETNERLAAMNEELQQKVEHLQRAHEQLLSSPTPKNPKGMIESPSASPEGTREGQSLAGRSASEERFRMITELSPFPISIIDSSGKFHYLNKKFEQLFGYTLADIPTEKDWCSKVFAGNPECMNAICTGTQNAACMEWDLTKPHGFPVTGKDGTRHQIHFCPITLESGDRFVVYEDLTDKTESERLRSVLVSIVNSSNDAIIGKSLEGTILSWNKAAERYYGYLAEEVIGKSVEIIIPPELRVHIPLFLQRISNGEIIDRFDTIRLRKDGSRIEVCVTLSPIKDDNGHIVGISTIAQNIAEREKSDVSRMFRQQVLHRR